MEMYFVSFIYYNIKLVPAVPQEQEVPQRETKASRAFGFINFALALCV
jgi:hypothetical protein